MNHRIGKSLSQKIIIPSSIAPMELIAKAISFNFHSKEEKAKLDRLHTNGLPRVRTVDDVLTHV